MGILTFGNVLNISNLLLLFKGGFCCSNIIKLLFILILNFLVLSNSVDTIDSFSNEAKPLGPLPINTIFKLPSPLPPWPPGGGFATGEIDLGGLQVRQITSFQKIWTTNGGGPKNLGATFFEPSPIPDGFSMLGSYAQPNNRPLSGWVLAGKATGDILKEPVDYTLLWSHDNGHFWLPTPPSGYRAVGLIVTASPEKPPLDKIKCVRSDFTADAEIDSWILNKGGVNIYGLRPKSRGSNAQPLSSGSFVVQTETLPLSCLTNKNPNFTGKLSPPQMEAVFRAYAPFIYLHPDEEYLPSSVNWFFSNGALLYKKGDEKNPVSIEQNGANLPRGGAAGDESHWLDLPADGAARERVKRGNLESAEAYLHFKTVLGGTFTDVQAWLFYPFNGHATAKLGLIKRISLGKAGEHVGDWEHVTLRVSNFDGALHGVYFSQHSGGGWVDSCLLQFQSGNRFVWYSSKNGHAGNYEEGLRLQGPGEGVGLRNDWARSNKMVDAGERFAVVAAEGAVAEPEWLSYNSKWGPTKTYDTAAEVRKARKWLPGKLKKALDELVKILDEVFGKEGPVGPNVKNNWNGDE